MELDHIKFTLIMRLKIDLINSIIIMTLEIFDHVTVTLSIHLLMLHL